jgi:hypothetical protein
VRSLRGMCPSCYRKNLLPPTEWSEGASSGATGTKAGMERKELSSSHTGFYGERLALSVAYTRNKVPRLILPLVFGSGKLTDEFLEAMGEVFLRYARGSWVSSSGSQARRRAPPRTGGATANPLQRLPPPTPAPAVRTAPPLQASWCGCHELLVRTSRGRPFVRLVHEDSFFQGPTRCGVCLDMTCPNTVRSTEWYRARCLGGCGRTAELRAKAVVPPEQIDQLRADLLAMHIGLSADKTLTRASLRSVLETPLDLDRAVTILQHRLVKYGVPSLLQDLRRLARAFDAEASVISPKVAFASAKRAVPASRASLPPMAMLAAPATVERGPVHRTLSPVCISYLDGVLSHLAAELDAPLSLGMLVAILIGPPELPCSLSSKLPTPPSLVQGDLESWRALWSPLPDAEGLVSWDEPDNMTFGEFVGIFQARLRPLLSVESHTAGPVQEHPSHQEYLRSVLSRSRPFVQDTEVWRELRMWGYSSQLRLSLTESTAPGHRVRDIARSHLNATFSQAQRAFSSLGPKTLAAEAAPSLTWAQLNAWRRTLLGEAALRRKFFAMVFLARGGSEGIDPDDMALDIDGYATLLHMQHGDGFELFRVFDRAGLSARLCNRISGTFERRLDMLDKDLGDSAQLSLQELMADLSPASSLSADRVASRRQLSDPPLSAAAVKSPLSVQRLLPPAAESPSAGARQSRRKRSAAVIQKQEDPVVPFAFNQRLLTTAALCIVFSCAGVLIAVSSTEAFESWANAKFENLIGSRLRALARAVDLASQTQEATTSTVRAVVDWSQTVSGSVDLQSALQYALDSQSQVGSNACASSGDSVSGLPDSLSATVKEACSAKVGLDAFPGLSDQIAASAGSLSQLGDQGQDSLLNEGMKYLESSGLDANLVMQLQDLTTQLLLGIDLNALVVAKDTILGVLVLSSNIAIVVAAVFVILNVLIMLRSYRQGFLRAIQGKYTLNWSKVKVARVSNFLGIAGASALLTFLGVWVLVLFVLFVLIYTPTRVFLWEFVLHALGAVIGVSLVGTLAQYLIVQMCLSRGPHVLFKRLFMLADLILSIVNLFTGFLLSVVRMGLAIGMLLINFMRPDQGFLDASMQHMDPATASFNALLVLDVMGGHPIFITFCETLVATLKQNRRLRLDAGRKTPRNVAKLLWLWVYLARGPIQLRSMRERSDLDTTSGPLILHRLKSQMQSIRQQALFGRRQPKALPEEADDKASADAKASTSDK